VWLVQFSVQDPQNEKKLHQDKLHLGLLGLLASSRSGPAIIEPRMCRAKILRSGTSRNFLAQNRGTGTSQADHSAAGLLASEMGRWSVDGIRMY